jgi:RNA polymerase sigma factor (sigma-70 family)
MPKLNQNPHTTMSDQELLARFYESHENDWLGLLLEKYTLLLYGVCMKYLKNAEESRDAVQQIFLKSITELHKYEVTYFSSWIYRIACNHCLMQLRSRNGKTNSALSDQLADVEDDHLADLFQKEILIGKLEEAMKELKMEQQQCIHLFYLEKKSYQEIVSLTGFSLLQVKSYIQNGKRNLRLLISKSTGNSI